MGTSRAICEQLGIDYIDFSIPENFIKLLDLIFQYKKHFSLNIRNRMKNFHEDTLEIFLDELIEAKYEHPLQVKEFSCIVKNEYWNKG